MRYRPIAVVLLSTLAVAFAACNQSELEVIGSYLLPRHRLKELEDWILLDRGVQLGGVGSDLWHQPGDPAEVFWMVTDRGPAGDAKVRGEKRHTFPVPQFDPLLVRVRAGDGKLKVDKTLPLRDPAGRPLTGLSNLAPRDEPPYPFDGKQAMAFDPSGVDPEGLVGTADGGFWLAEEYGPSLLRVDAEGRVTQRLVPIGTPQVASRYPVADRLPAILGRRVANRGFESLAISPDGSTLFAAMQSPLGNPDRATTDGSRAVRILAVATATGTTTAEYVYLLEPASDFDPKADEAADMKIAALACIGADRLLVLERTSRVAKVYGVTLRPESSILGGKWDDAATAPSLEALPDPAAAGVPVLDKGRQPLIDLSQVKQVPAKIEGLTVIDEHTVAIANDNDFGGDKYDSHGRLKDSDVPSELLVIRLATPLR